jgi:hypothetical protein
MKGNMSRTIEAIIAHMTSVKHAAVPPAVKRLTANWQNGLEAGGRVQRKLRFVFTNVAVHHPV